MREIIQICFKPTFLNIPPVLYALCNDGTIFKWNDQGACKTWVRHMVDEIPQEN